MGRKSGVLLPASLSSASASEIASSAAALPLSLSSSQSTEIPLSEIRRALPSSSSSSTAPAKKAEYIPLASLGSSTSTRKGNRSEDTEDNTVASSSSSKPAHRKHTKASSRDRSTHSLHRHRRHHRPSLTLQTHDLAVSPSSFSLDDDDDDLPLNSFEMGREYYIEDEATKPLKGDVSPISYSSIEGNEAGSDVSIREIAQRPGESLYLKKCALVNQEIDRMGMVSLTAFWRSIEGVGMALTVWNRAGINGIFGGFAVLVSCPVSPAVNRTRMLTQHASRISTRSSHRTRLRLDPGPNRAGIWFQQCVIFWVFTASLGMRSAILIVYL